MSVQIITGDCMSLMDGMALVDCVITDPPYGETDLAWDRWPPGWPARVLPLLKPSGSMWVFGSQKMFWSHRDEFAGWRLVQDVVWEKHNGSSFHADRFRRVHELALHFIPADRRWAEIHAEPQMVNEGTARTVRSRGRPAHWHGGRGASEYSTEDGGPILMRSVIYGRSEHGRAVHPTQKPIGVVEPLLLYSCPPGGTVLDPFAGSGTTGVVAQRHGRSALLIEASAHYAQVIAERLRNDAPLLQVQP